MKPPLLKSDRQRQLVLAAFVFLFQVCLVLAFYQQNFYLLGLPLLFVLVLAMLSNYQWLYLLLLVSLPFSTEISLSANLSLFVPTEPLIVVLALCFGGSWLQRDLELAPGPARHPWYLLLFLFFGWACFSTLFSVDPLKSVKYLLAQGLYYTVFFPLAYAFFRGEAAIRKLLAWYLAALTGVLLFVLGHHLVLGLSFEKVNKAVGPFFLNHVIYAVTAGMSLPFALYFLWYNWRTAYRLVWLGVSLVILLAILFSYTRATWLALPLLGLYLLLLRLRWLGPALLLGLLLTAVTTIYLVRENRFQVYRPDYEKTIFNKGNLEKHLQATYKLQDVSGMERIYRWIAAIRLAADKPLTGSGPSTFYPVYQRYTVKSFQTYVSDNPEKSTAHNYLLLQLAEQGFVGAGILAALLTYLLLWPQQLYHRTRRSEFRALILAAGSCLFLIIFHLLLNELLGIDKIAAFFFISSAILLRLQTWIGEAENDGKGCVKSNPGEGRR